MLCEYEPQANASTAFSSSPKLSARTFRDAKNKINLFTLIIKMYILFARDTITSTGALQQLTVYRGIFLYNICLITISNSVSDGANKSVLNVERS